MSTAQIKTRRDTTEKERLERLVAEAVMLDGALMGRLRDKLDAPDIRASEAPGVIQLEIFDYVAGRFGGITLTAWNEDVEPAKRTMVRALDALVEYFFDQLDWESIAEEVADSIVDSIQQDAAWRETENSMRGAL